MSTLRQSGVMAIPREIGNMGILKEICLHGFTEGSGDIAILMERGKCL